MSAYRSRLGSWVLRCFASLLLSVLPASFTPPAFASAQGATPLLGLPAYFWNIPTWTRAVADSLPGDSVIFNPNSGPGSARDAHWTALARLARHHPATLLGYVRTGYGSRPLLDVLSEVDRYARWYGVRSIFFDEVSNRVDQLKYYRSLASTVHAVAGAQVVLNPGTSVPSGYADFADGVNVFEGTAARYPAYRRPAWAPSHPHTRVWNLIYDAPAGGAAATLNHARSQHADVVYLTDATLTNPWDRLPTYWATERRSLR